MKKRIKLRPISYSDTKNVLKWRNNPNVKKFFIFQEDISEHEHLNWLKNKVDKNEVKQFIIYANEEELDIGSVYLRDIDLEKQIAEFGIFIGEESAQGKGYGKEAANEICEYGFDELKLKTIFLRVFADNLKAIQSYLSNGFSIDSNRYDEVEIQGVNKKIVFMNKYRK